MACDSCKSIGKSVILINHTSSPGS
jgi:hypothetical protein